MKKVITFVALACLLLLVLDATPVYANGIPALPHAFYGSVTVNGSLAPSGTRISATVDSGVIITNNQNPVATVGGSYGIDSPYLLVQGNITPGATITFYVNGVSTGQTHLFEAGGGPTEENLTVTIAAPPAPPRYYIVTNLFGIEGSFRISSTGEILEEIVATSEDGNVTITIAAGTIALLDGKPLETLTAAVDPSPLCPPPEDAHIIGLTYAFEPDGATFAPPITFTWSYDPDALPVGVAEKDLIIAYCDKEAGEWVELDCVVDTVNNIITASVPHFTIFAIIGTVRPPEEEEVAPPEEEEVVPPEEEEVAPPEEEIAPPEEEEIAPPEEEIAPPPGINWAMIGGIIGGVILVGLGVFFWMRRREY